MFKAKITKIYEMDVYVSSESQNIEFIETVAKDRANKYPEELKEVEVFVDWAELSDEECHNLDPTIGTGIIPLNTINLDTGGYGKQQI